ncbi:MAG: wax ester/triacylglycerol synthase domain-containing protein [Myxococcota bacterium]
MAQFEPLDGREWLALQLEDRHVHQHATTACVLESGALAREGGGVDIDRIREFVEARLYRVPLCRKRIARVPIEGRPVWVDDESFNLLYHVRHTHLPVPGDERQLKRLCGRLASQRLDHERPLWELWIVEGLEGGDRFALVAKAHASVARGRWGLGLLEALLAPAPDKEFGPGPAWLPQPEPGARELLEGSLRRRLRLPLALARAAVGAAREPDRLREQWDRTMAALREPPASESPFSQAVGPHRRVDWLALDATAFARTAERYRVSTDALLVALLSGALGAFLERRGLPFPFQRELELRAALPDADEEPSEAEGGSLAWRLVELATAERDPTARVETAAEAYRTAPRVGFELLARAAEWTPALLAPVARRELRRRLASLMLTPLTPPPAMLHLLGARVLEMVPALPLPPGQALRVAVLPHGDALRVGFTADWDLLPDLHDLVLATAEGFLELDAAAPGSQKG